MSDILSLKTALEDVEVAFANKADDDKYLNNPYWSEISVAAEHLRRALRWSEERDQ